MKYEIAEKSDNNNLQGAQHSHKSNEIGPYDHLVFTSSFISWYFNENGPKCN